MPFTLSQQAQDELNDSQKFGLANFHFSPIVAHELCQQINQTRDEAIAAGQAVITVNGVEFVVPITKPSTSTDLATAFNGANFLANFEAAITWIINEIPTALPAILSIIQLFTKTPAPAGITDKAPTSRIK